MELIYYIAYVVFLVRAAVH